VGLDVGVFRAEQLRRAVDCQLLDLVGELAAAIVALAGIALGVLVRQGASLRVDDSLAGVVLTGDHL